MAWLYCCWWRRRPATRLRGTSTSVVEKRSHGKARTRMRPDFLTSGSAGIFLRSFYCKSNPGTVLACRSKPSRNKQPSIRHQTMRRYCAAEAEGLPRQVPDSRKLPDIILANIDVLKAHERIGFRLRHGIRTVEAHLCRKVVLDDRVQLMSERPGNDDDILGRVSARDHRTLDLLSSNFSCPRCYCND